jgi:hypothetical protein
MSRSDTMAFALVRAHRGSKAIQHFYNCPGKLSDNHPSGLFIKIDDLDEDDSKSNRHNSILSCGIVPRFSFDELNS